MSPLVKSLDVERLSTRSDVSCRISEKNVITQRIHSKKDYVFTIIETEAASIEKGICTLSLT